MNRPIPMVEVGGLASFIRRNPWLLCLVTGALQAFAYPGYGAWLLALVGLVPLMVTCAKTRPWRRRFALGWVAGFAYYLLILPWMVALWDWAGWSIVLAYGALCAGLALMWGAWAAVAGVSLARHPLIWLLGTSGVWASLEALKSAGTFGFSWGNLGHALIPAGPLLQVASWTGEGGLTFLVVFVNAGVFLSWRFKRARFVLTAVAVVMALAVGGALQLNGLSSQIQQADSIWLALVQPNIAQRVKSDPENLASLRDTYLNLLSQIQGKVDLIVLPESILPTFLLDDLQTTTLLFDQISPRGDEALIGSFTRSEASLYNTALLFDGNGRHQSSYDKVQLVPFSTEYFPFKKALQALFPALTSLPLGMLSRGHGYTPLTTHRAVIGTPICFESSFGFISRAFVLQGAQMLVSITNDAWFKRSVELDQHWSMGILRAVETGRAFVQVANTGVSAAALPTGDTLVRLVSHEQATGVVEAPLLEHRTLYVAWGEWFIWLAVALAGWLIWGGFFRVRDV